MLDSSHWVNDRCSESWPVVEGYVVSGFSKAAYCTRDEAPMSFLPVIVRTFWLPRPRMLCKLPRSGVQCLVNPVRMPGDVGLQRDCRSPALLEFSRCTSRFVSRGSVKLSYNHNPLKLLLLGAVGPPKTYVLFPERGHLYRDR